MLEESRVIRRIPSESDRRVTCRYPTEKAQQALPQISQVLWDWEKLVTQDLAQGEQAAILGVLTRIKARAAHRVQQE